MLSSLRQVTRVASRSRAFGASRHYSCIIEEIRGPVGVITLNRPKALNALSPDLVKELAQSAKSLDANPDVGAIVVTGSGDKAFAAGADIKVMQPLDYMDMYKQRLFSELDELSSVRKPIIAAVNGFALGGGCELAMACDFILAADTATFGQPEIKLGTIPGLGGTQRFARALGKSRAMELVLTGDLMSAEEAVARGLASRVVPAAELLDDAIKTATKIARMSQPVVAIAKSCVNVAFESSLAEGLRYERAVFYSTFACEDQKIGMKAFTEKAKPDFKHH
jgi:enoyl-CoA hydratase